MPDLFCFYLYAYVRRQSPQQSSFLELSLRIGSALLVKGDLIFRVTPRDEQVLRSTAPQQLGRSLENCHNMTKKQRQKINCWKNMQCDTYPGGNNVAELCLCPAAVFTALPDGHLDSHKYRPMEHRAGATSA